MGGAVRCSAPYDATPGCKADRDRHAGVGAIYSARSRGAGRARSELLWAKLTGFRGGGGLGPTLYLLEFKLAFDFLAYLFEPRALALFFPPKHASEPVLIEDHAMCSFLQKPCPQFRA
jgi:hypothetical protein